MEFSEARLEALNVTNDRKYESLNCLLRNELSLCVFFIVLLPKMNVNMRDEDLPPLIT